MVLYNGLKKRNTNIKYSDATLSSMGKNIVRQRHKNTTLNSPLLSKSNMVPKISTGETISSDASHSYQTESNRIPQLSKRRSTEGSDSDLICDDFVMVRDKQKDEINEKLNDVEMKDVLDDEEINLGENSCLIPDSTIVQPGKIKDFENFDLQKAAPNESSFSVGLQVFFPFMIAGFGTVLAGLLLDVVQHWKVFSEVKELFILVPALLGLKGNLEMTLASRLSTSANTGVMDNKSKLKSLIIGNIILTQAQALVVAALASIAAVTFQYISNGDIHFYHANLLCASSLLTASLASLLLGTLMVVIIVLSNRCGVNPDNIATPIAASMGDLLTLALLSGIASFLFKAIDMQHHWIAPIISFSSLLLLPLWLYIAYHNEFTHDVLLTGWMPIILAMCLSSGGGLILRFAVDKLPGIAVFNPVVNGVGGNLVAVQASRLSTSLHLTNTLGTLPEGVRYGCIRTFCTGGGHSQTARVLLFISVPGHLIFLFLITWLQAGHTSATPVFIVTYLSVGALQVSVLLFVAKWMVYWFWKRKKDPDNFCIPYLTALGDFLGTALLAIAFEFLYLIGDKDIDVGD